MHLHYYSSKRQLLGNNAGQVPPAWRDHKPKDGDGSKILLSRLPPDVGELEVEELFRKTVGPLKEVFLIYNNQGRSKGMAIVVFHRPGDAAIARAKYDGKFVDGRRPIKIEIIADSPREPVAPPAQAQPSLLVRLGEAAAPAPAARKSRPIPVTPRRRQKKGPRRVKKTVAQLDQEMEDYRAAAAPNPTAHRASTNASASSYLPL